MSNFQIRCTHCESKNIEMISEKYFICKECKGYSKVKSPWESVAEKLAVRTGSGLILAGVGFIFFGPTGGLVGLGLSSKIVSLIENGDFDPTDFI